MVTWRAELEALFAYIVSSVASHAVDRDKTRGEQHVMSTLYLLQLCGCP